MLESNGMGSSDCNKYLAHQHVKEARSQNVLTTSFCWPKQKLKDARTVLKYNFKWPIWYEIQLILKNTALHPLLFVYYIYW